jgi:hypothetical protein
VGRALTLALLLLAATANAADPPGASRAERLSLYADQYHDLRTGQVRTVVLRFYRGTSPDPLDPVAFYHLIQRPDLALSFREAMREKISLVTSGLSLAAVGLGLILGAVIAPTFRGRSAWLMGASGGAFFGIGWSLAQNGANEFPHPIGAAQAREFVNAYNNGELH